MKKASATDSETAKVDTENSANTSSLLATSADHLSWLEADDFAEALLGANTFTKEDPRKRTITINENKAGAIRNNFFAVPAIYETASADPEQSAKEASVTPGVLTALSDATPESTTEASSNTNSGDTLAPAPDTSDHTPRISVLATGATAAAAGVATMEMLKQTNDRNDSSEGKCEH